jgi:hypothetical protein
MACKHRAVIIFTKEIRGTSSNLAAKRLELQCKKPEGHEGPHHDPDHGEDWEDRGGEYTHLLRTEADDR